MVCSWHYSSEVPKVRILDFAGAAGLIAACIALAAVPAYAIPDTRPTASPTSVEVGAAPAFTFTYSVSNVSADATTGVGVSGFAVAGEDVVPVLSGITVTCSYPSGITATWESAGFSAGTGGVWPAECRAYDFTSTDGYNYFELYLGDDIELADGEVTLRISAGGYVAPSTAGTYGFQAYSYDYGSNDYTSRGFGSIAVTRTGQPSTWTVVRQGLPMPESGGCDAVQDAKVSWGTGLTGGWQRAWEPWAGPLGGMGGWACTRVLVNQGGSTWSFGT